MRDLEDRVVLWLIVAISAAFAWILLPLYGAILWAVIAAILFAPLYRRLSAALGRRPTLAALATVAIIVVMVILPLTLITASLVQEATGVYDRVRSGELSPTRYFQQVFDSLPAWAAGLLERFGLANLGAVQERLSDEVMRGSQALATRAINIGQSTFDFIVNLFVMLYLLFFLLRDGDGLFRRIRDAIPLRPEQRRNLAERFATVIRATVKGNIVVALVQGALGGMILWLLGIGAPVLWGAVMALLSLLPAVGAAIVWLPVGVYLLVTGAVWKGMVLIAFGMLVIGLIDNILRPILVGKDTQMPDYLVLLSTLGGIAVFGINGFVLGPVIAALFITIWDIASASRAGRRFEGSELGPGAE